MNTKTYVAATLAALAAAVWAASASAGKLPWPGDPRVCSSYVSSAHHSGSDYQRNHCAMHAAAVALRAAKGPAVIKCYRLGKDTTMLRWDCLARGFGGARRTVRPPIAHNKGGAGPVRLWSDWVADE